MAAAGGRKLKESIIYQLFLDKIEEEEAWVSKTQQLLTVPGLGDNMTLVLSAVITNICEAGQNRIISVFDLEDPIIAPKQLQNIFVIGGCEQFQILELICRLCPCQ